MRQADYLRFYYIIQIHFLIFEKSFFCSISKFSRQDGS